MMRRRMLLVAAMAATATMVAACSGSTGGPSGSASGPSSAVSASGDASTPAGSASASTGGSSGAPSSSSGAGSGSVAGSSTAGSGSAEDQTAYKAKLMKQPVFSGSDIDMESAADSQLGCPDWSKVTADTLVYSVMVPRTTLRAVDKSGLPVAQCQIGVPLDGAGAPTNATGDQMRLGGLSPQDPTMLAVLDQPAAEPDGRGHYTFPEPPTKWGLLNLATSELVDPLQPGPQFSQEGLDRTTVTAVGWKDAQPVDPKPVPTPTGEDTQGFADPVKVDGVPMDLYCSVNTQEREDHLLHSYVQLQDSRYSGQGDSGLYSQLPATNGDGSAVQGEFWFGFSKTLYETPGKDPYYHLYVVRRDASSGKPCQVASVVTFTVHPPELGSTAGFQPLAVLDADSAAPTLVLYDRHKVKADGAVGAKYQHSRILTIPLKDADNLSAATVVVPDLRDSPDVVDLVQFPASWLSK